MEIKGAVALVTGGAKGLGLAIAKHLQSYGAHVIVVDIDFVALGELPNGMTGYQLDVTCIEKVKLVIECIVGQYKRIDILVNNAGVIHNELMINVLKAPNMAHEYSTFRQIMTANLDSVFIMTTVVVEQMVMQRIKGVIVNLSSISAIGNEGQTAYSAAKAGVNALTVTWSKELGKLGIRCNAIAPGFINTESTHFALNESVVKEVCSKTPLRRLGETQEVVQALSFVISNDFINGAVIPVNGGLTI